jgi:glycosyltransferase involved in cell wall biosynthesis
MTQPGASSASRALFLAPEPPSLAAGGGGLRSASLLEYLRSRYAVDLATFTLPHHSRNAAARAWRNGMRLVRGRPPLFDRFSGCEAQIAEQARGPYRAAVIEHFWCAPYAAVLRPHADLLALDLHNIESVLAATHARATRWPVSMAFARFAAAYRQLEREWFPRFDLVLVASEEDRRRVEHPNVHVYPNALPKIPRPQVLEQDCIVFSGNLEYHPNVEAVRWFRREIWPRVRARCPELEWHVVGRNPQAVRRWVAGDDRIVVTGPVENAVEALAAARVCVVPLRSGSGTRFKILEAWAGGRAVVSTTLGAEGLGARSGEHLLLADDPAHFADAVARLLEDPELRRVLGDAGRALYLERFTWPAAWRALEETGL